MNPEEYELDYEPDWDAYFGAWFGFSEAITRMAMNDPENRMLSTLRHYIPTEEETLEALYGQLTFQFDDSTDG